jgi:DNA ligase-1
MNTIHDILTSLNSTSKKNDKIDIIKKNFYNTVFQTVLYYTYNKLSINYYIKKFLPIEIVGSKTIDNNFSIIVTLLNDLSTRNVTGNDALTYTKNVMEMFDLNSQDIIQKIIKRDLKCGFSENTINKAIPNLIPTFDVALAKVYDDHKKKVWNGSVWYGSRKMNGLRCVCKKINNEFSFWTRKGKQFFTMSNLIPELKILTENISDIIFDGEICIIKNGLEDFKAIQKEYKKKNHTIKHPRYKMFDVLTIEEFNSKTSSKDRTFSYRYVHLQQLFLKHIPNKFETLELLEQVKITKESFAQLRKEAREKGYEGNVLRKDEIYKATRSDNILKVKDFIDEEFIVIDIEIDDYAYTEKGKGQVTEKMMTRVNILIDGKTIPGKHKVGVGSGWSLEQRKDFMNNPKHIIGKTINVRYFERSLNESGGESLQHPTVKHIYEKGRDN